MVMRTLPFASDYQEGAHPAILKRLCDTNLMSTLGYGTDEFCEDAKAQIRAACACPEAAVYFLIGGTQMNATVIDAFLRSYEGVIAAKSGHISVHEAGAIEFGGHKVLEIEETLGKLSAKSIDQWCSTFYSDGNHEHMVAPGMVYLSQPTEYGTLYSLRELTAIREVCTRYHLHLYVDGARLAYALACRENDVTLSDLAHLCDAFYIGGTKCGCLFGEALVVPHPDAMPHFFTIMKQHGALMAKGRLLGIQFAALFTDELYRKIGQTALETADRIRAVLKKEHYRFYIDSPTNQIFIILENEKLEKLSQRIDYSFWEVYDESHTVIRLATSWATTEEEIAALTELLKEH